MRLFISIFIFLMMVFGNPAISDAREKVTFKSADGLRVTADLYTPQNPGKPKTVILLFHQEDSSRGEYKSIAPRLTEMGYTALAVDLRVGGIYDGTANKTVELAQKLQITANRKSVYQDMFAAVIYAKTQLQAERVLIWGSSYTASLSFLLAGQSSVEASKTGGHVINGVIAFSPGEDFNYFPHIQEIATTVQVPVFITSSRGAQKDWQPIFEALPTNQKAAFVPDRSSGNNGSLLLTSSMKEKYWAAVTSFLSADFNFRNRGTLPEGGDPEKVFGDAMDNSRTLEQSGQ